MSFTSWEKTGTFTLEQTMLPPEMVPFDVDGDVRSWIQPQLRCWARSPQADGDLCTWTHSWSRKHVMSLCQLPTGVIGVINCACIEIITCFICSRYRETVRHQVADIPTSKISNVKRPKGQHRFKKHLPPIYFRKANWHSSRLTKPRDVVDGCYHAPCPRLQPSDNLKWYCAITSFNLQTNSPWGPCMEGVHAHLPVPWAGMSSLALETDSHREGKCDDNREVQTKHLFTVHFCNCGEKDFVFTWLEIRTPEYTQLRNGPASFIFILQRQEMVLEILPWDGKSHFQGNGRSCCKSCWASKLEEIILKGSCFKHWIWKGFGDLVVVGSFKNP